MASKRCPHCGLVNPGSATGCDCGYSFESGTLGEPLDLSKPGSPGNARAPASNVALRILIFFVCAAIATALRLAFR